MKIRLTLESISGDEDAVQIHLTTQGDALGDNIDEIFIADAAVLGQITLPFFDSLHDLFHNYQTIKRVLDLSKVQN